MICVSVPDRVMLFVPDPLTDTPVVPAVAVSVPLTTEMVACTVADPASTSAMLNPVPCSVRLICSVALYVAGVIVAVGGSFTALTVMVAVSVAVLNAVDPPFTLASARVPAAPLVWSHAWKVKSAVVPLSPSGTKRIISVLRSSNAEDVETGLMSR